MPFCAVTAGRQSRSGRQGAVRPTESFDEPGARSRQDCRVDSRRPHRPFKMPGWAVRVNGKATRITSSPTLGEHTDQVLSEELGLTAQAVAEMKREGVI